MDLLSFDTIVAGLSKMEAQEFPTIEKALQWMEENMEDKPEEMGTEYVYDSKGIRFIKYKGGNAGLRFSELKK